jgi:hypothetical protein
MTEGMKLRDRSAVLDKQAALGTELLESTDAWLSTTIKMIELIKKINDFELESVEYVQEDPDGIFLATFEEAKERIIKLLSAKLRVKHNVLYAQEFVDELNKHYIFMQQARLQTARE